MQLERLKPAIQFVSAFISLLLFAFLMSAQLPPDQKLSAEDEREFHKELERLEKLLSTANDEGAIQLQIANTYAAGGQFTEAISRLRKVVEANLGFDPSRDPDFAKLRNTAEFRLIMAEVLRQTPPIHHSRHIATLYERDIRPESIAFDRKHGTFLLGNTARFDVVRCSLAAHCVPLFTPPAGEEGYVLGLKIDVSANAVWITDNKADGASLRCYGLDDGKLRRFASIKGTHVFNDLAISLNGTVYVSDTAESSVYQLPLGGTALHRLAPQHTFTAANGVAIGPDEELLYVSTWGEGIDVINLRSGAVTPMIHPGHICLAFVDGLYATKRGLIAIQNGPMLPRIVEFTLSRDRLQIIAMRVLERRNPNFDGITTGAIVQHQLYYVANPQTDKKSGAEVNPFQIFSVRLP